MGVNFFLIDKNAYVHSSSCLYFLFLFPWFVTCFLVAFFFLFVLFFVCSSSTSSGLKRTGKSCRLRWLNYLKPDIKRGNLTPQEQLLILELHSKWGNR